MRFPDQSLKGDLNDNTTPRISTGVFPTIGLSTTDENDTVYDLLPVLINRPPVITKPITEASTPQIRQYSTADASGDYMYLFPDGTVKINIGASVKIAIEAQQPNVLNVENGILKLIPPTSSLTFIWRKDSEILNSTESSTLQSSVIVSGSVIEFNNIQPSSAGTYLCEISNDIGTTISETITIEVLNLDFDVLFYRNLIKNPLGIEGTNEWNANNSDLITKPFAKIPSQEFIRPNRVDLFGYTIDMMHPRPYQIEMGAIQNFDMTQIYTSNPTYFTRTRYKYEAKGGTFVVRAYQDIDLTDIIPLIKGGIFGVEGVRALFSCYIGNGISQFIPVEELVDVRRRTNPFSYYESYPRISLENFLTAGPALLPYEKAYVTVEEFDNETRLPISVIPPLLQNNQFQPPRLVSPSLSFLDPWTKRNYTLNSPYSRYPVDIYGLGQTLDRNSTTNRVLAIAEGMYLNPQYRYTYGQYIEFNKAIIERLNPKTNKVRITMNFESTDWRVFESFPDLVNDSDEIFELLSWESPYEKNKFTKVPLSPQHKPVYARLKDASGSLDKTPSEFFPSAQDPRVMVTGLNFALLPILTQQPSQSLYYTRTTLVRNPSIPNSSFPSGLSGNRVFDPFRINAKPMLLTFKAYSDAEPTLNNLGYLQTNDRIELRVKLGDNTGLPNTQPSSSFNNYQITTGALLPFAPNSLITYHNAFPVSDLLFPPEHEEIKLYDYIRYRLLDPYQSQRNTRTPSYNTVVNGLASTGTAVLGMSSSIAPRTPEEDRVWLNKMSFRLMYGIVNADGRGQVSIGPSAIGGGNDRQALQVYNLEMDFNNPSNTKVKLVRPAVEGTILTNASFGRLSEQPVQSTELEHIVDPYGVLQCTIPPSLKFTPIADGGFGLKGYRYQFEVRERSLIKLITALHVNLGNYTRVSLRANRYYQSRVEQALSFYDSEIQFAQNNPTLNVYTLNGVTINDLQDFRQQLVDYAYDIQEVPNQTQYATILRIFENNQVGTSRFSINIFNPAFYLNNSPNNSQSLTVATVNYVEDTTGLVITGPFAQQSAVNQGVAILSQIENNIINTDYVDTDLKLQSTAVFNNNPQQNAPAQSIFPNRPILGSNLNLFREIPPHLLNMRTSIQKLEFLAIRNTDLNFTPGTPAGGTSVDGINYNVYFTPIQDISEGIYTPSSQD